MDEHVLGIPIVGYGDLGRCLVGNHNSVLDGSATNPEQFKWLYGYSPYQHVKKGVNYPAVLFMSGDGDTRVAPLHARKMAALMQADTASDRPILLRYELKAGHSAGRTVSQTVAWDYTERSGRLFSPFDPARPDFYH